MASRASALMASPRPSAMVQPRSAEARLAIGLGLGAEFVATGTRWPCGTIAGGAATRWTIPAVTEAAGLFGEVAAGPLGFALEGCAFAAFAIGPQARLERAGALACPGIAAAWATWRTGEFTITRRTRTALGTGPARTLTKIPGRAFAAVG